MNRYHKKVYFPDNSNINLQEYTEKLNNLTWKYSKHSIDRLQYRGIDSYKILLYIKELILDWKNIFEYYVDNNITKAVYRIKYNTGIDLILVISSDKKLITIYINTSDDDHVTLDSSPYVKGDKSKNNSLTI